MRIGITGHTKGLGKAIHDHFKDDHELLCFSRSNGFDLETRFEEVIEQGSTCDVFFNNAYVGTKQATLILGLYNVTKVITSGSMAAARATNLSQYDMNKKLIERTHVTTRKNSGRPMLLLRMGYLESFPDKQPIRYSEVLAAIDFWLTTPRVSMIEFENNPPANGVVAGLRNQHV